MATLSIEQAAALKVVPILIEHANHDYAVALACAIEVLAALAEISSRSDEIKAIMLQTARERFAWGSAGGRA